jgi:hypothetical protein
MASARIVAKKHFMEEQGARIRGGMRELSLGRILFTRKVKVQERKGR